MAMTGSPVSGAPATGPAHATYLMPCPGKTIPGHFLPTGLPVCPPSPLSAGGSPHPPASPINDSLSPTHQQPMQLFMVMPQGPSDAQLGFGCNNGSMLGALPQRCSPAATMHCNGPNQVAEGGGDVQAQLVLLSGLPNTLCDESFLEVMFEQAGLASALLGFELHSPGQVLVKLTTRAAALHCAAHFKSCRWGSKDIREVKVTFPGDTEGHSKQQVTTGRFPRGKLSQNQYRPQTHYRPVSMPSSPVYSPLNSGTQQKTKVSFGSWGSLADSEDSTHASASTVEESTFDECGYSTDDGF